MPVVISLSDTEQKTEILVEVEKAPREDYDYKNLRSGISPLARVGDLYGKALDLANVCARELYDQISKLPVVARPTEYEVQFGIKMDTELGALIAKSTAGAQLQVTFKWVSNHGAK